MSATESRPTSNLYSSGVNRMSNRSLASDSDAGRRTPTTAESPYAHLMMDNPAFIGDASTPKMPKPAGTSSTVASADEGPGSVSDTGASPNKLKGKKKPKKMTDKNALRRMFDKRYKRMIRSHTKSTGQEPGTDPFSKKSLNAKRRAN